MGFLTPAFMIGLGALAVPLLIHLIRRERADALAFPSLMFLSRIPQPVVKRRRIRNWWLFALRCLALILLVGAFARPFVARDASQPGALDQAREVVILLDRSYSMGYGDRWDRAVAAVREAVTALGPEDRASLVLFGSGARAVTESSTDHAGLLGALDRATVGAEVTRYTPALKLAQSILAASQLNQREVVLVSDFQRAGWEGATGAQLPGGATLRPVAISDDATSNTLVTHVTLRRQRIAGRERVTPIAHLANRGDQAASLDVTFEADGRAMQTVRAEVPAGGTSNVELQPITLDNRPVRATVRAGTDALPIDNVFHFVLEPSPGLRVVVVEPQGRDASLYLRRALELGQDPPFNVTVTRSLPSAADLSRADVVVLNDVLPSDGEAGRRLVQWVKDGGGLVLAAGDRVAAGNWSAAGREIAGGAVSQVIDRLDDGGARLGFLEYSHPVFEPFRAPRAGAFGAARFYRYHVLPSAGVRAAGDTSSVGATVLARFDDGSIALIERPLGGGRALVWGTTLDANWTNIALEPVYLPLVHEIVKRAAGFTPTPAWSVAGQIVDVGSESEGPLVVNTPGGGRIEIAAENTLVTLNEPGFYEVREARADGNTVREHAVNVDVAESDLASFDPTEMVVAVTAPEAERQVVAAGAPDPAEQERRQALWWYLMFVVFGLLTAEAVFANRRTVRPALR